MTLTNTILILCDLAFENIWLLDATSYLIQNYEIDNKHIIREIFDFIINLMCLHWIIINFYEIEILLIANL